MERIRSLDKQQMAAYGDPVFPYEMGGERVKKTGNLSGFFFWLQHLHFLIFGYMLDRLIL